MSIMLSPFEMLFALCVAHSLADYPLQGAFLAEAKDRNTSLGKLYWPYALSSHGLIHGGFVFLLTGSVWLGAAEAVTHSATDWLKCEKKISMLMDQFIHYACKILWVALAFS